MANHRGRKVGVKFRGPLELMEFLHHAENLLEEHGDAELGANAEARLLGESAGHVGLFNLAGVQPYDGFSPRTQFNGEPPRLKADTTKKLLREARKQRAQYPDAWAAMSKAIAGSEGATDNRRLASIYVALVEAVILGGVWQDELESLIDEIDEFWNSNARSEIAAMGDSPMRADWEMHLRMIKARTGVSDLRDIKRQAEAHAAKKNVRAVLEEHRADLDDMRERIDEIMRE